MQYWLCEYQSECDVPVACKKLDGFFCHGTSLRVMPALKAGNDAIRQNDISPPVTLPGLMMSPEFTKCMICDKNYSTAFDLSVHLLLSHKLCPNVDTSKTAVMKGKVSKQRPCSETCGIKKEITDNLNKQFDIRRWVTDRPYRNPDYVKPDEYVLDTVIGVRVEKEKLGFIPIDHLYANIDHVVRGMVPNSVINGPDSITFHPSMACLMSLNSKFKYVPVEHSYAQLDPPRSWCSVCGRKYDSLEALNNHLPVHFKKKGEKIADESYEISRKRKLKRAPKEEMFTCKMCSNEFDSKSVFIAHVTTHENDDEVEVTSTHKCQYCHLIFSSDIKMIKHQLLHECEKCNEKFDCLKEAQIHRDSHVLSEKAKCCCEICGQKFLNPAEFLNHLLDKQHPITKQARKILNIPRQAEYFGNFTPQTRQGDFHCLKCSKTCEDDMELYSHMGFHFVYNSIPPPYLIPIGSDEISPASDESSVKEYQPVKVKISLSNLLRDASFNCENVEAKLIPSTINNAKEILIPELLVNEEAISDASVCKKCDKKFGSVRGLKTHRRFCKRRKKKDFVDDKTINQVSSNIMDAHPVLEPEPIYSPQPTFNCMKCDIVFDSELLLTNHINMIHHKKETVQVKIGKAKKSALKLFRCKNCDKTFAQELGLKAHSAAAHSDISFSTNCSLKEVLKSSLVTNEVSSKIISNTIPSSPKTEKDHNSVIVHQTKSLQTVLKDAKDQTDSDTEINHSLIKRHNTTNSPIVHETSGHIRARKTAAKLFKCKTCDIRFGSKRILSFHMQQHADGKIKLNKIDGENYSKNDNPKFLNDMLTSHDPPEADIPISKGYFNSGSKNVNDIEVSQTLIIKSRKVAKKTIIKKVFECDICEELFTKRTEYIHHIKSHTNDPNDTSSMSDAGEVLQDKPENFKESIKESGGEEIDHCNTLKEHISLLTPPTAGKDVSSPMLLPITSETPDYVPNDAIFYVDDDKLDDLMNGPLVQPIVAAISSTGNDSVNKLIESIDELKTCNICKKQFVAWSTICAHVSTHPGATFNDVSVDWKSMFNPIFECVICQERIHSVAHCYLHYKFHVLEHCPTALISHIDAAQNYSSELQSFRCSVCGLKFDKVGTLHNHIKIHIPRVGFDDPCQVVTDHAHEKCTICHRIVTPKSKRRHFEIHDQDLKHICELCYCEFPNQGKYIKHYYVVHKSSFEKGLQLAASAKSNGIGKIMVGSENPISCKTVDFQCTYCRSTFLSAKSKRNHEYKHTKGIFKIPCSHHECLLYFQTNEELVHHVEKMGHAIGLITVPCSVCDAKFLLHASKSDHEKCVHNINNDLKEVSTNNPGVVSETIESSTKKKPEFSCNVCQKCFDSTDDLNSHLRDHICHQENGEGVDKNDAIDEIEAADKNKEIRLNEEFTCLVCNKNFASYSERWLHEEEFESLGSFKCMDCGLDYKTKHLMKTHECNTKPSLVPVDEEPKSSTGLRIIGFAHRKCHACNKLFTDKESFKYHVRKHWYRCFSCHYDFCSKKSMKAHFKLQKCFHPNTDGYEKAFDNIFVHCLLCEEAFSISDHINMHFLDHTIKENGKYDMYICMMCGAPYKIIEQLKVHMKAEGYFMLCREFPHLKDINNVKELECIPNNNENSANGIGEHPQQWGCPFCSTKYNNYKSAWSHIRSYHKSQGKPFKTECDKINGPCQIKLNDREKEKYSLNETDYNRSTEQLMEASISTNDTSNTSNAIKEPDICDSSIQRVKLRLNELLNNKDENVNCQKSQSLPSNVLPTYSHPSSHGTMTLSHDAASKDTPQNASPKFSITKSAHSDCQSRPSKDISSKVARSRSSSETSNNSNPNKKSQVTSPAAAAKTAGLIAQILRGPLLPSPISPQQAIRPELSHAPSSGANAPLWRSPPRFLEHSAYRRKTHPNHDQFNSATRYPDDRSSDEQTYGKFPKPRPVNTDQSQRYNPYQESATFEQDQNENPDTEFEVENNHQSVQVHSTRIVGNSQRTNIPMNSQRGYNNSQVQHSNGYTNNKRMKFEHPVHPSRDNSREHPSHVYPREHPVHPSRDKPREQSLLDSHHHPYQQSLRQQPRQQLHQQPRQQSHQQYHQHEQPRQYPQQRNRFTYPSHRSMEHSTAENISWQSELSSRSPDPAVKNCVHKCTYCQRIFKNYINVYNHLVRNHTSEIPSHRDGQIKPISSFDGRMTVWSLVSS